MTYTPPVYSSPDFQTSQFSDAPITVFRKVVTGGVAPDNYHATSIYPEYFQIHKGEWHLLKESRMDCVVVNRGNDNLAVIEFRHLKVGDMVACGRTEDGSNGIFVHASGFAFQAGNLSKFAFRTNLSRESSFSIDYDNLYELLEYEKKYGYIVWVLGPALVFDKDARKAFVSLVKNGYVHTLFAGNAMAVHDIEGAFFETALGQNIYTKHASESGHYNHLDTITKIRAEGSIRNAVDKNLIKDGIMKAIVKNSIPYVLAGSIRDDGPLPDVIDDVYKAQDKMRSFTKKATTVIAMATQLHGIATGNMLPSYRVIGKNQIRPVYFYSVDMSEFAINKLADRGSLSAKSFLTNVQDFVVTVERGLKNRI